MYYAGLEFKLSTKVMGATVNGEEITISTESVKDKKQEQIKCDTLLVRSARPRPGPARHLFVFFVVRFALLDSSTSSPGRLMSCLIVLSVARLMSSGRYLLLVVCAMCCRCAWAEGRSRRALASRSSGSSSISAAACPSTSASKPRSPSTHACIYTVHVHSYNTCLMLFSYITLKIIHLSD